MEQDGLWARAPGWRWAVTVTLLLSGFSILLAPGKQVGKNASPLASYRSAANPGASPVQSPVQNTSPNAPSSAGMATVKNSQGAYNPAFGIPQASLGGGMLPKDTELHLVGVYQGALPAGQKEKPWWANCSGLQDDAAAMMECHQKYAGQHSARNVTVDVGYFAKPVALVLMAYEPVKWNLSINSGTRIEKIIISGYHGQDIGGVPNSVPVEARSYEPSPCQTCIRKSNYFYAYKDGSKEYSDVVKKLEALTGLTPSSFQGSYEGAQFSLTSQNSHRQPLESDSYVGKIFKDQVSLAGQVISLPEGSWKGVAIQDGPSSRGADKLLLLARANPGSPQNVLAIRVQLNREGNGFPKFTGCTTSPNYGGDTKTNESFGPQLCYQVNHVTSAWDQPFLALAKNHLVATNASLPETVVASSFHKADMNKSIDLLHYALPSTGSGGQREAWDTSPWHPRQLVSGSEEALFVQKQLSWSAVWYQLFSVAL